MDSVETDRVLLTLRDDGIVHMVVKSSEQTATAADIAEDVAALIRLAGKTPRPTVWDVRNQGFRLPGGAWRDMIEGFPEIVVALAIIVNDGSPHPLGAFPEAIDTFLVPVRIFTDEAEAWEWIANQVA